MGQSEVGQVKRGGTGNSRMGQVRWRVRWDRKKADGTLRWNKGKQVKWGSEAASEGGGGGCRIRLDEEGRGRVE